MINTINKTRQTFALTDTGKLPTNNKMACEKYGVYAFLLNGKVIRFGESASGFRRIQKGFNHQLRRPSGKKNYHAYHFREELANLTIEIRYYSDGNLLANAAERRAIEAELAYQFKAITGAWPSKMIEIHFSNDIKHSSQRFIKGILKDLSIGKRIHAA